MQPFRLDVPSDVLDDLHRRLAATLLPLQTPGDDWSRGIPPHVLGELLTHWRERYDWRAREAALNGYEQFTVDLDGCRVHVLWRRGSAPGRLPVVLTHGWPYTFAEMLPTLDAIDGELDVVVPSLPGYAYSEVLPVPFAASAVAHRWQALMTEVLGYDRYLTYGEDVGAGVSDWLAGAYPQSVAGIVASHPSFSARSQEGVTLTDEEEAFYASLQGPAESGYAHQQGTRPDTLAAALTDSPAGLLAWIGEKFAAWSDGDRLERVNSDDLITTTMLYWVTRSIGTSFRAYCDPSDGDEHPLITVPASIIVQTHEAGYPRSLAEKSYLDIRAFTRLTRGGHFTAFEAPGEVADAILTLERQANPL
ncbi:epoxide hydrolase [Natronosporangium hydrolyticum]|uniref:Epoxide hydrolase n=1 Tax=Natronosporangium hydrolyticum TaxID=2811111 RepID=A0A895YLP7_9ACTN|nr:epoxide hydrolase family protein [Natronosporangium hydrolyticum]QSB16243.1 epoxide hydrolase [Natronosporangium hydrolyticum]